MFKPVRLKLTLCAFIRALIANPAASSRPELIRFPDATRSNERPSCCLTRPVRLTKLRLDMDPVILIVHLPCGPRALGVRME